MAELAMPANAKELYEMLTKIPDLCGRFILVNDHELEWDIYKGFSVLIGISEVVATVIIERKMFGSIPVILTHWHSKPGDICGEISDMGLRGNVLVIRKSFLSEAVLYAGPEGDCPYSPNRKWHWGRIYYLKAE